MKTNQIIHRYFRSPIHPILLVSLLLVCLCSGCSFAAKSSPAESDNTNTQAASPTTASDSTAAQTPTLSVPIDSSDSQPDSSTNAGSSATPQPETSATSKPDNSATSKPDNTATSQPETSATPKPETSATSNLDNTATPKPETSATSNPDDTATPKPETSATTKPDNSATPKPETSATTKPDNSATPKPDNSATPKPDSSVKQTPVYPDGSPAALHGQLHVDGSKLTDMNNETFQLRGISSHGLQWFPQYINAACFQTLYDDMNINVIRLAMYTDDNSSYPEKKESLEKLVRSGIELASDLGIYVIVDWHNLSDGDPNAHIEDAKRFFKELSSEYQNYTNIIYEICNEPNGSSVSWSGKIKPYGETIIPVIRANDPDSVILIGTPTWCQEIDAAAKDPLDYENIMYTLHFYADTHREWLRDRLTNCLKNYQLPVFVSEFGTCDCSGNTGFNAAETDKWIELLNNNQISWVNWSLSNKNETCAILNPTVTATSGWADSDYSQSGMYIKNQLTKITTR